MLIKQHLEKKGFVKKYGNASFYSPVTHVNTMYLF